VLAALLGINDAARALDVRQPVERRVFYVRLVWDRDKSADIAAGDQRCANSGQIVQVVKPRGEDGIHALVGSGDY
jgi:hypothetical protein